MEKISLLPLDAAPLEKYTHIIDRVQTIWEYPEISLYLERLIVSGDPNRPHRQGFPLEVGSDIICLYVLINNL